MAKRPDVVHVPNNASYSETTVAIGSILRMTEWVITWSLVLYLSRGATTPGKQASQLTPCAKCIVFWAAHRITRLIGSFMHRTAYGFNTFRCWYIACDVYYAGCDQGWAKVHLNVVTEIRCEGYDSVIIKMKLTSTSMFRHGYGKFPYKITI